MSFKLSLDPAARFSRKLGDTITTARRQLQTPAPESRFDFVDWILAAATVGAFAVCGLRLAGLI